MIDAKPFVVDPGALRVASPAELNQLGEWSEVLNWPHTPVSAANLPDGRILTFASSEEEAWPAGQPEFTYAAAWDPVTGEFKMVPHNTHDMFCAELVLTDTGQLHVAGGRNSVTTTSLFDFETDTWIEAGDMETGRWYPTSVSLPNGNVLTALGSGGTPGFGPVPELWTPSTEWQTMNGIDMTFPIILQEGWDSSSWPFLFISPRGELFHAGPTNRMHYINLNGTGSMRSVGNSDKGWYGKRGANVMYEENKIMIIGGSAFHPEEEKNVGSNQMISIDISAPTPLLTEAPPMNHARITHNAILLPDGQILVIGGQTEGTGDDNSVLTPELYNPETGTWTELADMSVPRNYHSTALLMTDGRVWSGGGGFCTTECAPITHSDAQVFSPPYLFDATGNLAIRPTIDVAPENVQTGETFTVNASTGMTRFTWIKMSATTHQMNTDLRRLYAEFSEVSPGVYEINAHLNPNILTPGYWMLFAVDQNGVPSEAAVIQVTTDDIPEITAQNNQFSVEGEIISLYIDAFDNDPLTYTATGLPQGLSISETTGEVYGVLEENTSGLFDVSISATDGLNQTTTDFTWTISKSQGELGSVAINQVSESERHQVDLQNAYMAPVVILGPPTNTDEEPVVTRVQQTSATSFDVFFDEWDSDGIHTEENISYLVLESGVHYLADGRQIQAGTATISSETASVSFHTLFDTTPIVFAQIGAEAALQEIHYHIESIGTNDFEVRLVGDLDDANVNETIYWIAIEPSGALADIGPETGIHSFINEEEATSISLEEIYSPNSPFFAATQASNNNATALSLQQRTATTVDLFVHSIEQQNNSQEGSIGYMAFSSAGPFPFKPNDIPPIVLSNPGNQVGVEGQVVYLWINVEQDNGDPVVFSATGLPEGVTINPSNGLISGGLAAGNEGLASVTVFATDGISEGVISFDWIIYGAPGEWLDYSDDSALALEITSVPFDDAEEKDLATGDLDRDGWEDIIVVRKEPFMGQDARPDLLLMNEAGNLVDRTTTFAPSFLINPTIARDVVIEDFDRDGWKDVLIANTFGDQPRLYRNQGDADGTWLGLSDESSDRLPVLDTGSIQYCAVAAGDVNGDGFPDLYFANYVLDGVIEDVLLINDGTGNFTDEGAQRLGDLLNVGFGTQATIIDIDFDGDNDIVKLSANHAVAPFDSDGIFIIYNDGTGNFSTWSTVPSNQAYMYAIGDFNNDAAYDFYIADDALDYVQISESVIPDATITFSQETMPWVRTAAHGANIAIADLDRDGDLDIGVADVDTSSPPCESEGFRAFLLLENKDTASGSFIDPYGAADKPWNRNMYDFAFIDINKDGNTDIFTADCAGYGVFTSTLDPIDTPGESTVLELGDLRLGIAVHDPREGTGYIMFSEESIHTRFADTPHSDGNADHLIAVVFENGQWTYDYNKRNLEPFTPLPTDHLLAEVDFTEDIVVHLTGIKTTINGIDAGYESGDLVITPEVWNGLPGSGEFWVTGTRVILETVIEPENNPPTLEAIENRISTVGDTILVSVSAADLDDDPLQLFAAGLPTGLALNDTEISGILTEADSFNVTIGVSDGQGGVDSTQFVWTVDPLPVVNTPPTLDEQPDRLSTVGDTILVSISANDLDNDPLQFIAAGLPTGLALNDMEISGVLAEADTFNVTISVSDGRGGIDSTQFGWTVSPVPVVNVPPQVMPIEDQIHILGDSLSLSVVATDANGDSLSYLAIGLPTGLSLDKTKITGVPAVADTFDVNIVVSDGKGGEGNTSFNWIIQDPFVGTGISQDQLPQEFALGIAYPNPFTRATTIEYQLPYPQHVRIEIYSITGQRVQILEDNAQKSAGFWRTTWNGTDAKGSPVATGLYLIRFKAGDYVQTGKVILVR